MINAVTKACSGPAGLEDDPGDSMKNHLWRSDGGQELRSVSAGWAGCSQEVFGQRDSLLREQRAQSLAKTQCLWEAFGRSQAKEFKGVMR